MRGEVRARLARGELEDEFVEIEHEAIKCVEEEGIIFLDGIDKTPTSSPKYKDVFSHTRGLTSLTKEEFDWILT